MTKHTNDLFEELAKETNSSAIDDLLANPFDEAPEKSNVQSDLIDATILSQRAVTTEKLIERLPEHRQKQARDLASQIDENNMGAIIAYGSNAQKKLSEFSHAMLNNVQLKDTGEIADVLTDLMHQLATTNPKDLSAEPNVFQKFFGKVKASIAKTQSKYQKIGGQIDRIAIRLEREKNELLNDNLMLEQLYQKNKDYFEGN